MKQIPNSNYSVDEHGNVYGKYKKLKTNHLHSGYRDVTIRFNDGTTKKILVHRLVASAYLNNPENKPPVNHIDGNKSNNHVSNLEWSTYKENNNHARKNGYFSDEDGTAFSAVYTADQIHEVCRLLSENRRNIDIEKSTSVSKGTIYAIRARQSWLHVSKDYEFRKSSRIRKFSDATIHWICLKIAENCSNKEILENCDKLDITYLYKIKRKEIYKDISDNYFN